MWQNNWRNQLSSQVSVVHLWCYLRFDWRMLINTPNDNTDTHFVHGLKKLSKAVHVVVLSAHLLALMATYCTPPFLCKLHIVNTMSLVHIGLHLMLPLAADCCDVSAETLAWRLPVTLADFWSAWVVSTSYALLQRLRTLRTTCFVVFQSLSSHYTAWWTSKQLVVLLSIVCCLIKAFLLPQFCEWVRKSSRLCSICDLGSILEVTKTAAFRSVSPDM